MTDAQLFIETKTFVTSLAYTQPRIIAMLVALPIFNQSLVPGMLRFAIAAALGALAAPVLMPTVLVLDLGPASLLVLVLKEAFIGFVLGLLVAIPFWAFEAVGYIIDNQRGASISATLNPLTGNDSSPLGILFNQAFIVYFFVSGGFLLMLGLLYQSFVLWDVFSWLPRLRPESAPLFLDELSRLVSVALLLGSPAIVAMFMAEIGLALISRFVPQLQVFFLAMPIKCAIGLLVLVLYTATLFDQGWLQVQTLRKIVPFLEQQWGGSR